MGYEHFRKIRVLNATSEAILGANNIEALRIRVVGATTFLHGGYSTLVLRGTPSEADAGYIYISDNADVGFVGYLNHNVELRPLGTGKVKFGTYTTGAATDSTGYIAIVDAAGTTRKLMVQA